MARRRTIPASAFLCSFFFLRLESASASFPMELAVSLAMCICGVIEFPIDVRRLPGLEAPFFPLVLVITCLYEHRNTGGFFYTYRAAYWMGGADSAIPPPCIPDVCLGELPLIAEVRFKIPRGGLLHTHRCEIRTIPHVWKRATQQPAAAAAALVDPRRPSRNQEPANAQPRRRGLTTLRTPAC